MIRVYTGPLDSFEWFLIRWFMCVPMAIDALIILFTFGFCVGNTFLVYAKWMARRRLAQNLLNEMEGR